MGKEQLACPSCGKTIEAGVAECPYCGLNIRSGEPFEMRVRRAKAAREGPVERLGARLGLGTTIVLGLVFLGGFLYQRRAETVFRNYPDEFVTYIWQLESIDALAAAGRVADARVAAQELIEELRQKQAQIRIEAAPTTQEKQDPTRRPKAVRRAHKSLLGNLAKKAEFKLHNLPLQPEQSSSSGGS